MIGWHLCFVAAGRCDLCGGWLAAVDAWRHWRADTVACCDFTACEACADRLLVEVT